MPSRQPRMFKILQRYVSGAVATSAAIAMLFIGFIFGAVNLIRDVLGYVIDGRIPFTKIFELCWFMAQYVAIYSVPIGLLIAVLLVLGRMSADNEITAMRTSGLSILQITRPILILALIGVVAEFGISFYLMPRSRVAYHVLLEQLVRDSAANFFTPKTFIREIPDAVIFFDRREDNTYHNFWVWKLDDQKRATHIYHATAATIEFNTETEMLTAISAAGTFEVRSAADPETPSDNNNIADLGSTGRFELSLKNFLGKHDVKAKLQWLTLPQLIAEKNKRDADPARSPVERLEVLLIILDKLTSSLAVFSFALLAIPLGIRTQRKESSANIGIALLLVVVYYVLSIAVSWMNKRPELHPEILIWLPNIVFVVLGFRLLRRVEYTR